jgi:hypothetical protein
MADHKEAPMLKPHEEIWREGFAAAGIAGSWCPYRVDSGEFEVWERGWMQGYLKHEGCKYRDGPNASDLNDLDKGSRDQGDI